MTDTTITPKVQSTVDGSPFNYERLKALGTALNRPLGSLICLSDDNDPFLCDRPGRRRTGAEWFASLWTRLDVPDGVHLRRLHYLLLSTAITLPDGTPYLNTHRCWKLLGSASQDARYLDLVPAGAFVDRRAAEPVIFFPTDMSSRASLSVHASRPAIEQGDTAFLHYAPTKYDFPELPSATLYPPTVADPYAIELWSEKSTMNDVLLPLAQRRGITLITGVGELSITHCLAVARRAREHRRKTRILYVSDFDPAGDGMPISVGRKIEFFLRRDGDDLDIRLNPLILTAEQVTEYALPKVPIKESDRRRAQFEARYGTGAVELDALEALHPGALRRIIEAALDRYAEPVRTLRRRLARKASEVQRTIGDIVEQAHARHSAAVNELEASWEQTETRIAHHQEAIAAAITECEATIAEDEQAIAGLIELWQERADPVWQEIASEIEQEAPNPDQIVWPTLQPDEDADPLFDSRRDYLDQIRRYKQHQGKGRDDEAPSRHVEPRRT